MTLLGSEHSILIRSKFRSGKSPDDSVWKLCLLCCSSQQPGKTNVNTWHLQAILHTLISKLCWHLWWALQFTQAYRCVINWCSEENQREAGWGQEILHSNNWALTMCPVKLWEIHRLAVFLWWCFFPHKKRTWGWCLGQVTALAPCQLAAEANQRDISQCVQADNGRLGNWRGVTGYLAVAQWEAVYVGVHGSIWEMGNSNIYNSILCTAAVGALFPHTLFSCC